MTLRVLKKIIQMWYIDIEKELFFSHEKKQNSDSCYNMNKTQRRPKRKKTVAWHMIPSTANVQNRSMPRGRERGSVPRGLAWGTMEGYNGGS